MSEAPASVAWVSSGGESLAEPDSPSEARSRHPSSPRAQHPQPDIATLLRELIAVEHKTLHAKLQAEFNELRSAVSKLTIPRRGARTVSGHSDGVQSNETAAASSHEWIARSMRSYAAAAEVNESSMASAGSLPELVPTVITKGAGSLSRAMHQSHSSRVTPFPSRRREFLMRESSSANALYPDRERDLPRHTEEAPDPAETLGSSERQRATMGFLKQKSGSASKSFSRGPSREAISAPMSGADSSSSASSILPVNPFHSGVSPRTGIAIVSEAPEVPEQSSNDFPNQQTAIDGHGGQRRSTRPHMPAIPSMTSLALSSSRLTSVRGWSLRYSALCLVRSNYFENVTLAVILANTVMIGVHADYCARHVVERGPKDYQTAEAVFAIFFGIELTMRLFAFRCHFFCMHGWQWNALDATVVLLQILEEVLVAMQYGGTSLPAAVGLVRLMRLLRLVRVIRIVRLLRYMSELRTVVVSLTSSLKPLLSSVVLLALVVYIVGIYFTQLVLNFRIECKGNPEAGRELEQYFGSVGAAVMSLFQTVTGGVEWRDIAAPLMQDISPAMGPLFALYIAFMALALMNIVTGVFVESALLRGREDKEVFMISHLRDLFGDLDKNQNGMISWAELEEHLDNPKLKTYFKEIDIDVSEARGLFHLLDRDGSGNIDADEFLSGCLRLRGPAKALDLQLVMRELAEQRKLVHRLADGWEVDHDSSDGKAPLLV